VNPPADLSGQLLWASIGVVLAGMAFLLRVAVNAGRSPGGVDTWYYFAYADAVRARPRLEVRLPQYLLQDEVQSYAPLFPSLLALLPRAWLRKWFWTISPAIDCAHLVLLYWLALAITGNIVVSTLAGCLYAFTPQLVSETRSLNGRALGALLHSIAVLAVLRYVMSGDPWPWLPLALLFGAALFLASATGTVAYAVVCCVLTAIDQDFRYLLVAGGAVVAATVLSAGHFLRVAGNYLGAVEYWRRNRYLFGAHPVRHSPLYGGSSPAVDPPAQSPGFLGETGLHQLARLLGENPLILALPLVAHGTPPWGPRLYWWAVSLAALSVAATVLTRYWPFGPGRSYVKAAVLPTALTLAAGIGTLRGLRSPVGLVTAACFSASIVSIGFFYWYVRNRRTGQTAAVPEGLAHAVRRLAELPPGGFLCLPSLNADYACYHSDKPVLWGGHCGNLSRF